MEKNIVGENKTRMATVTGAGITLVLALGAFVATLTLVIMSLQKGGTSGNDKYWHAAIVFALLFGALQLSGSGMLSQAIDMTTSQIGRGVRFVKN